MQRKTNYHTSCAADRVLRCVRIRNPTGLHLRLAAAIAKATHSMKAEVCLEYQDVKADSRSVLSMVALGAGYDAEIVIHAEGVDARRVVAVLEV